MANIYLYALLNTFGPFSEPSPIPLIELVLAIWDTRLVSDPSEPSHWWLWLAAGGARAQPARLNGA